MNGVAARLSHVRERIAAAAERAGRDPGEITLVAVSKLVPTARMREAMAAGQRDFGESRAQEAAAKYKEIGDAARWHFVGRLQRNKVRQLVGFVDLVHSLDRAELAAEIEKRAARPLEVLIEVNTTGESAKGGVLPEELPSIVEAAAGLTMVRLTGLMTMAPVVASPDEARPFFRKLAQMREDMRERFPALDFHHLSMGMSQDYEAGVEEGATIVRVGEAIFGPRSCQMEVRQVAEAEMRK